MPLQLTLVTIRLSNSSNSLIDSTFVTRFVVVSRTVIEISTSSTASFRLPFKSVVKVQSAKRKRINAFYILKKRKITFIVFFAIDIARVCLFPSHRLSRRTVVGLVTQLLWLIEWTVCSAKHEKTSTGQRSEYTFEFLAKIIIQPAKNKIIICF